jgi:hypothetical protein
MVEFWRSWSLPTPAPTRGNHYSLARLNLFVGAVRLARFRRRPERLIRQNSGPKGGLSHQAMQKVEVGRDPAGRSCKTLRILVDCLARKPRISCTIELCASGFFASGKLRNRYHYDAENEGITVGRGLRLACFDGLDVLAISFGYAGEDLSYRVSLAFRRGVPA